MALIVPIVPRADSGWALVVPLLIAGCGLGLLVSQLNNYTLSPIEEERVSEAAGVNSAAGSFGLSFGLAMAGGIMLAVLSFSFTNMTEQSAVIPPAQQQQIADTLEDDAEVMSNTQLEALLADEPESRAGRDPPHQRHRREPLPAGGAARADPRQPARAAERRSACGACPTRSRRRRPRDSLSVSPAHAVPALSVPPSWRQTGHGRAWCRSDRPPLTLSPWGRRKGA